MDIDVLDKERSLKKDEHEKIKLEIKKLLDDPNRDKKKYFELIQQEAEIYVQLTQLGIEVANMNIDLATPIDNTVTFDMPVRRTAEARDTLGLVDALRAAAGRPRTAERAPTFVLHDVIDQEAPQEERTELRLGRTEATLATPTLVVDNLWDAGERDEGGDDGEERYLDELEPDVIAEEEEAL